MLCAVLLRPTPGKMSDTDKWLKSTAEWKIAFLTHTVTLLPCFLSTSGVAERFEVERQLFHTLPGLLIMLRVFRAGYQGHRLSLGNLQPSRMIFIFFLKSSQPCEGFTAIIVKIMHFFSALHWNYCSRITRKWLISYAKRFTVIQILKM